MLALALAARLRDRGPLTPNPAERSETAGAAAEEGTAAPSGSNPIRHDQVRTRVFAVTLCQKRTGRPMPELAVAWRPVQDPEWRNAATDAAGVLRLPGLGVYVLASPSAPPAFLPTRCELTESEEQVDLQTVGEVRLELQATAADRAEAILFPADEIEELHCAPPKLWSAASEPGALGPSSASDGLLRWSLVPTGRWRCLADVSNLIAVEPRHEAWTGTRNEEADGGVRVRAPRYGPQVPCPSSEEFAVRPGQCVTLSLETAEKAALTCVLGTLADASVVGIVPRVRFPDDCVSGGWDMLRRRGLQGHPADPEIELAALVPGVWRIDFFALKGSLLRCGSATVTLQEREQRTVFLDRHEGHGSLRVRLGGQVGHARWMLTCRGDALSAQGGVLAMNPAGTLDFSGVDVLQITGLTGDRGRLYLWPQDSDRKSVRFDLRRSRWYELD